MPNLPIPIEIWKDIVNYEGSYQVSNLGKIRGLKRVIICKNHRTKSIPERPITQWLDHKGYYCVDLSKQNKRVHHRIHRLIAQEFIPNPLNKPEVNHKNGIKLDNSIENLEWV